MTKRLGSCTCDVFLGETPGLLFLSKKCNNTPSLRTLQTLKSSAGTDEVPNLAPSMTFSI